MIIDGIGTGGKPENIRSIGGAMAVASDKISSTPEVIVTTQDLTSAYAAFGAAQNMDGYSTLGIKVEADVGESETVSMKVMGMVDASDTPFDVDAYSVKALWTTGASDFTKYYEFEAGSLPYLQIEAIAGTVGTPVEAYLTGGANAEDDYTVWALISDGELVVTIDGTSYEITGLDFSAATDMDDVAAVIEAGINTATGTAETFVWSTDHFIGTSISTVRGSEFSVFSAVPSGAGTDIATVALTDCNATNGVATAAVLVGALTITVIKS